MRISIAVVLAIACSIVAGCAQPINVQVVDAQTGLPIPGAGVERWAVMRPYFIVGVLSPHEWCETDSQGQARLKERRGGLQVAAPGYKNGRASLATKERRIVVELKPVEPEQSTTSLAKARPALPASASP